MAKYHIKADGTPGVCRARVNPCPLGGAESHFASKEEAQAVADKRNEATFTVFGSTAVGREARLELAKDIQEIVNREITTVSSFISQLEDKKEELNKRVSSAEEYSELKFSPYLVHATHGLDDIISGECYVVNRDGLNRYYQDRDKALSEDSSQDKILLYRKLDKEAQELSTIYDMANKLGKARLEAEDYLEENLTYQEKHFDKIKDSMTYEEYDRGMKTIKKIRQAITDKSLSTVESILYS